MKPMFGQKLGGQGDWLTALQGNGLTAFFGWLVAWRCEDVDRSKRRCVSYFLSD